MVQEEVLFEKSESFSVVYSNSSQYLKSNAEEGAHRRGVSRANHGALLLPACERIQHHSMVLKNERKRKLSGVCMRVCTCVCMCVVLCVVLCCVVCVCMLCVCVVCVCVCVRMCVGVCIKLILNFASLRVVGAACAFYFIGKC